jgi:hypothetical protein
MPTQTEIHGPILTEGQNSAHRFAVSTPLSARDGAWPTGPGGLARRAQAPVGQAEHGDVVSRPMTGLRRGKLHLFDEAARGPP